MAPSEAEAAPETVPEPEPEPEPEPQETRRPRHTKPRRDLDPPASKLVIAAGRAHGVEPADIVSAIVDNSRLDGEDVRNVRVLERFSLVEVPADRAADVVSKVAGSEVRGVKLELEVANR
ncbi:MAG: DbpA RNA binding domain-containing protein [Thermoleophilaceae bacterium]|nr:DbpA RNA binding domain-containing protein [Thermoleophilaceae bacterium]